MSATAASEASATGQRRSQRKSRTAKPRLPAASSAASTASLCAVSKLAPSSNSKRRGMSPMRSEILTVASGTCRSPATETSRRTPSEPMSSCAGCGADVRASKNRPSITAGRLQPEVEVEDFADRLAGRRRFRRRRRRESVEGALDLDVHALELVAQAADQGPGVEESEREQDPEHVRDVEPHQAAHADAAVQAMRTDHEAVEHGVRERALPLGADGERHE